MSSAAAASSSERINRAFQHVPELARAPLAAWPLKRQKWIDPTETVADDGGKAAFVEVDPVHRPTKPAVRYDSVPLRDGYVFGAGPRGFGYYHVLTKQAYVILTPRLQSESSPTVGCGCFGGGRKPVGDEDRRKALEEVAIICHHRSKSPVPDDLRAQRYGIEKRYEHYY